MAEIEIHELGSVALFDSYVQHCLHTLGVIGTPPGTDIMCILKGVRVNLNNRGECTRRSCEDNTHHDQYLKKQNG